MEGSSNRFSRLSVTTGTRTSDSLDERSRVISTEIETTSSSPALWRLEAVARIVPLASSTVVCACSDRDAMTAMIKTPPSFIVVLIMDLYLKIACSPRIDVRYNSVLLEFFQYPHIFQCLSSATMSQMVHPPRCWPVFACYLYVEMSSFGEPDFP